MADQAQNHTTVIGSDTRIKGEMSFDRTARIHGSFEGAIQGKGELQVADGATCNAAVQAQTVLVDGNVQGDVVARERIQLNAKANLQGDLTAGTLVVAEGAALQGQVRIGPDAIKNAPSAGSSNLKVEVPGAKQQQDQSKS